MSASFEEVAKHVEALYSSGDPAVVQTHQKVLQEMQKSPRGFELAEYLLSTNSKNCQYFGALTYSVVISLNDLDAARSSALMEKSLAYIKWLSPTPQSTREHLVIIRKLMSNISSIFNKAFAQAPNPVWAFVGAGAADPDISQFPSIVSSLSPPELGLLLEFLSILVEDVSKSKDYRSRIHSHVRSEIYPLLLIVYEYLVHLKSSSQLAPDADFQALQTLTSWMSYIPNINGDSRYDDISVLVHFLHLHLANVEMFARLDEHPRELEQACQCLKVLNEIFEINPNILSHEQKQAVYAVVFGDWGTRFIDTIVVNGEENQEETSAFVDLILVLSQLNAMRLSKAILEESSRKILGVALRLTNVAGTPFVEDFVSERMLVFWEDLASVYQDSSDVFEVLFETNDDPGFKHAFEAEKVALFNQVAQIYWRKLHLPDFHTYSDVQAELNSYRTSVADFFTEIYSLLKIDFYSNIAHSLVESSHGMLADPSAALDVEATMFLLHKINEDSVYFESQAVSLTPFALAIFNSGIIEKFGRLSAELPHYNMLISTFIQFLSSNEFFLKTAEGSAFLGDVFQVTFPIVMGSTSSLSLLASKMVTRVCEECSEHLVAFLPDLERIVVEMLKNPAIDSLIRSRMFSAYSVIAKDVNDVTAHSKIISGMLNAIADSAHPWLQPTSAALSEMQEDYLISLLSCLVNIVKGSSLSDDAVDELTEEAQIVYRQFWAADPDHIKSRFLSILQEYSLNNRALANKTIVAEKCVLAMKSGLGERLGGPFAIDNETIAQYAISVMDQTTNRNAVPFIHGLVECLISVNFRELDSGLVLRLVDHIFTQKLAFLKTDPDMIKSAIEVFTKILERKPALILFWPLFSSTVVVFAIEGLSAGESFIIKSISKFWTALFSLKKGTREDHAELDRLFVQLNYGSAVAGNLISAFLKAPRSNLEYYYTVFRALIGKYPLQFKSWLVQSLENPEITKNVGKKEIDLFIHTLLVTRGRRTANDVLKSFWLQVNGLIEYNSRSI